MLKKYAVKNKGINVKLFSNFPPQMQPVPLISICKTNGITYVSVTFPLTHAAWRLFLNSVPLYEYTLAY